METDEAINEIMIQSYEDLLAKNYEIVLKTCKYAEIIIPKNNVQEDFLLRIKINYAIALKRTNSPKLNEILKAIKVGTATPIFKIAHKILSNDFGRKLEKLSMPVNTQCCAATDGSPSPNVPGWHI